MTPDQQLKKLSQSFPDMASQVETFVSARGERDFADWPEWCFLPIAGWLAIAQDQTDNVLEFGSNIADLAAIGTWRYSQGVYHFDDELYSALMASEHNGKIPVELFKNLPEWSIYIPLKEGIVFANENVDGFWVHLEFDVNSSREELRFLLNMASGRTLPIIMHLSKDTLDNSLQSALDESIKNMWAFKMPDNKAVEMMKEAQEEHKVILKKLLPLVLYLVSEPPEEDDPIKNPSLSYPTLKKTKKGFRLFPAKGIRNWHIGKKLGETLRKEREQALGHGEGTKKAPHLRRGHWHGFWHGKGRTKFKVKWVKPVFVG